MNRKRWLMLVPVAIAILLGASLITLLIGVSHAQVIVPATTISPTTPSQVTATVPPVSPNRAATELPRTIVVVGEGQVVAQPGFARFECGVETVAPTIAEAIATNEATLEQVIASLETYVAPDDIRTTSYSVYPERDYQRGGLAPILGYHVTHVVQVTVRDLTMLGSILEAATSAGANQIYGVSFDLDADTRARAERDARSQATANLRAHARELAQLHEVRLAQLVNVSETIGANTLPPYTYAEGLGGAGGPTITPGGLSVIVRLQATYAIAD